MKQDLFLIFMELIYFPPALDSKTVTRVEAPVKDFSSIVSQGPGWKIAWALRLWLVPRFSHLPLGDLQRLIAPHVAPNVQHSKSPTFSLFFSDIFFLSLFWTYIIWSWLQFRRKVAEIDDFSPLADTNIFRIQKHQVLSHDRMILFCLHDYKRNGKFEPSFIRYRNFYAKVFNKFCERSQ